MEVESLYLSHRPTELGLAFALEMQILSLKISVTISLGLKYVKRHLYNSSLITYIKLSQFIMRYNVTKNFKCLFKFFLKCHEIYEN